MSTATARVLCLLFGAALLWTAEPRPSRAQDAAGSTSARPSTKSRGKHKLRSERGKRTRASGVRVPRAEGDKPARAGARRSRGSGERSKPRHAREAGPPESAAAAAAAQAAAAGVDAEIVKDGDTSVKVMKFSGLGIEGRLKSPQLVYFVQRVRAEFERPSLPHRSFMPELERTTAREPVR